MVNLLKAKAKSYLFTVFLMAVLSDCKIELVHVSVLQYVINHRMKDVILTLFFIGSCDAMVWPPRGGNSSTR